VLESLDPVEWCVDEKHKAIQGTRQINHVCSGGTCSIAVGPRREKGST